MGRSQITRPEGQYGTKSPVTTRLVVRKALLVERGRTLQTFLTRLLLPPCSRTTNLHSTMPPIRDRDSAMPAPESAPRTGRRRTHDGEYASDLTRMRGELRDKMTGKLRELTRDPHARMCYSVVGYGLNVVHRRRYVLRGWPWYADIAFGNLSDVVGRKGQIWLMLALWDVGILRFEPATEEEVELGKRSPREVLPGSPWMRTSFGVGPALGRDTIKKNTGKARRGPRGLPRRKNGPKTPKTVEDSD
ncbi:hypothetical protein C8Q80DRAFT_682273 [Daedaleopsis nitida]|nr:hypothetical protein C8Q80DRAFT_682273 [Daedaleopsis nitida]